MALARSALRDGGPIAQLQCWLIGCLGYGVPPGVLPLLSFVWGMRRWGVSLHGYSARDRCTPPCAVFSIQAHGSVLSNVYWGHTCISVHYTHTHIHMVYALTNLLYYIMF